MERPMNELSMVNTIMFLAASIPIATIDVQTHRIPDYLSLGLVAALILATILIDFSYLVFCLTGAITGFLVFWLINRITQGKLGMGDAKYSGAIGAALGPIGWFWAVLFSSVLGIVLVVLLLPSRTLRRDTQIPFAPFMATGSALALFVGAPLSRWLTTGAFH